MSGHDTHLNLVFSLFIIATFFICVASPPPTPPPPPPKCASPPTPPPPPTFHHQEKRRYAYVIFFMALGVNSFAVFLFHQTQKMNPPPNPQAPIHQANLEDVPIPPVNQQEIQLENQEANPQAPIHQANLEDVPIPPVNQQEIQLANQEANPPANPQAPIQRENLEAEPGPLVNPQEIQLARERARVRLKLTILKFLNLLVTLFFFFVTMHLQYKYKNPTKGEAARTLSYSIFAFVILSGFLKSYWDFGHVDFVMTMLSSYLINAIEKNYRMLYVIAMGFILLFFALDGYYHFVRSLYDRCKAHIETIYNHHHH